MAKFKHFGDRIIEDFMQAGESVKRGVLPQDFPSEELEEGVHVEMEHTNDPVMSLKIVLDHEAEKKSMLDDRERYYTGLSILEQYLDRGMLDVLLEMSRDLGIRPRLRKLPRTLKKKLDIR